MKRVSFGRLYYTTTHFLFLLTLFFSFFFLFACLFVLCVGFFLLAYLHKAIAFGSISEIQAEL